MLIKNIVGAIIILLNMSGLGYLFFIEVTNFFGDHGPTGKQGNGHNLAKTEINSGQRQSLVIDEAIIPDEDDLLKDMDLSDLDRLDLDDFE